MNINDLADKIGKTISDTLDFISDKNKTNANLSRIKTSMRHEIGLLDNCYIELGKYCFENMRNDGNPDLEELFATIGSTKANIKELSEKYKNLKNGFPMHDEPEYEIIIETEDGPNMSESACECDGKSDNCVCENAVNADALSSNDDIDDSPVSEPARKTIGMILNSNKDSEIADDVPDFSAEIDECIEDSEAEDD